jgi:membrane-associated protein
MSDGFSSLVDFIYHLDRHLIAISADHQTWTYVLLFVVFFAETGLIVTPLLPGDSLLFATGLVTSNPHSKLNIVAMFFVLIVAVIAGDVVNFSVGTHCNGSALQRRIKILRSRHIARMLEYFNSYGTKIIIYARFIPVIRTFAPFAAGLAGMPKRKFLVFSLIGGIAWVAVFLFAGFAFGRMPIVREHFTLVMTLMVVATTIPAAVEWGIRSFRARQVA